MLKKLRQYVKPFSSNPGTLRTDGQTDGQTDRQNYISISRVSVLTRDKNYNHSCYEMRIGSCILAFKRYQ